MPPSQFLDILFCVCCSILFVCLFFIFSLCILVWEISIYLSSSSLILFKLTESLQAHRYVVFTVEPIKDNLHFCHSVFYLWYFHLILFLDFPSLYWHYPSVLACCLPFSLNILILAILNFSPGNLKLYVISKSGFDIRFITSGCLLSPFRVPEASSSLAFLPLFPIFTLCFRNYSLLETVCALQLFHLWSTVITGALWYVVKYGERDVFYNL